MLEICLGLGILLDDATRVLFTEEDAHPKGTPGYIMNSIWGPSSYDNISDYTSKLQGDLRSRVGESRYVNWVYSGYISLINIH